MLLRILALLLVLQAPALAQPAPVWDDSDPEMQALFTTFAQTVPCGTSVTGLCEEALNLLRGGGDRMAAYLLRQPEPPFANPWRVSRSSYLLLAGATESETAVNHLTLLVIGEAAKLEASPDANPEPFYAALEGLGNTRDKRALAVVDDILRRFPSNTPAQYRAVRVMQQIQWKHGPLPEIASRLGALERERAPAEPSILALESSEQPALDPVLELIERIRADPNAMKP